MKKSKLLAILDQFSTAQHRQFGVFLQSPYFNKKDLLVELYHQIIQGIKKYQREEEATLKKEIFRGVFPKKTYKEALLNHLFSELFALVEQFIAQQKLEQEGIQKELLLLDYYLQHNLDKHYSYLIEKASKKLDQEETRDEKWYYQQAALSEIADRHFLKQQVRKFDHHLQEASNALDVYYLTRKMRYICAMLDRQKAFSKQYELRLKEEVVTQVVKPQYQDFPLIQIYYQLLQTLTQPEQALKSFYQFKDNLLEYYSAFNKMDAKSLFYFGINFCVRQFRLGNKAFAQDLMQLYQKGIDSGVLLEDGFISPWTFKNIVKLGLGLKQLDWTRSFIDEYGALLPKQYHSDVINYNLAEVYYYQKNLDGALEYLNKTKFTDIHYNLHSKVMLTKIFWENQSIDALEALLSSFYIYLKRQKEITKEMKVPYFNYIKCLQLMIKQEGRGRPDAIESKIKSTKLLTAKSWLLQQIHKED